MNENEKQVVILAAEKESNIVGVNIHPKTTDEYNLLEGKLEGGKHSLSFISDVANPWFFQSYKTEHVTIYHPGQLFTSHLLNGLKINQEMVLEWGVDEDIIKLEYVQEFYHGGETTRSQYLTWEEAEALCQN